jgi:hypothetical protein
MVTKRQRFPSATADRTERTALPTSGATINSLQTSPRSASGEELFPTTILFVQNYSDSVTKQALTSYRRLTEAKVMVSRVFCVVWSK